MSPLPWRPTSAGSTPGTTSRPRAGRAAHGRTTVNDNVPSRVGYPVVDTPSGSGRPLLVMLWVALRTAPQNRCCFQVSGYCGRRSPRGCPATYGESPHDPPVRRANQPMPPHQAPQEPLVRSPGSPDHARLCGCQRRSSSRSALQAPPRPCAAWASYRAPMRRAGRRARGEYVHSPGQVVEDQPGPAET
jgi:hypothetical protein